MKKMFLILFVGLLLSCTDKDDKTIDLDLIGKWRLIEVLLDPGDGSGTFYNITSDKTIEFHSDGTITSNGSICAATGRANIPSAGTYSLVDSTISSPDCANDLPFNTRFKKEGSSIIISYPCVEPCKEKYIKTQNESLP